MPSDHGLRPTRSARIQRVMLEGLIAGAAGALLAAITYAIFDLAADNPLRTPETVHQILIEAGLITNRGGSAAFELAQIAAMHGVVWVGTGLIGAWIVSYVDLHPKAWAAVFSAVAFIFLSFFYLASLLSSAEAAGLPLWAGTLAGSAALAWVLVGRHRGLLRHFEQASLTEHTHRDIDLACELECSSREFYRTAHQRWPQDAAFDEMLALSHERVEILEKLCNNYQCEVPPHAGSRPSPEPDLILPASVEEAYRAAAHSEAKKADLYHQFLLSVDENQTRNAFTHLQWYACDGCPPRIRGYMGESK
jgi:hypothetical protein